MYVYMHIYVYTHICIRHCCSEHYALFKPKRKSTLLGRFCYPCFTNLKTGNQKHCHSLKSQNYGSYTSLQ